MSKGRLWRNEWRTGEEAARRSIKNALTKLIRDFDKLGPHRLTVEAAYAAELRKWRRTIRIKEKQP